MPLVTKLVRVVTYHKELPPKNSYDPSRGGLAMSCDKLNTLNLHLQNTHGHQTRQGAYLP